MGKAKISPDIEIAQEAERWSIARVAERAGLSDADYESYGIPRADPALKGPGGELT